MQIFWIFLLLSPLTSIAADNEKPKTETADLCLDCLRRSPDITGLLTQSARRSPPPQHLIFPPDESPDKLPQQNNGKQKAKKTQSGPIVLKSTEKPQHKSQSPSWRQRFFNNKSPKESSRSIDNMGVLRLNTLMASIKEKQGREFVSRAERWIEYLENYYQLNIEIDLSPSLSAQQSVEDEETDQLLKKMKKLEKERLKTLITSYKTITAHQREELESPQPPCNLSQLAHDSVDIVSSLYKSLEHSETLFAAIDLVLMRAIEILIALPDWNQKKITEIDGILERVDGYRKQMNTELNITYTPCSPLRIATVHEVLDMQRKQTEKNAPER